MKCLSVSQPFADLIISGKKTIEMRNWNTKFRGEILIHAPLKIRTNDCKRLKITKKITTGAIVGKVTIYDVKKYNSIKEIKNDKKFHFASQRLKNKQYGFMLKNAKQLRIPIPCKGKLGIFEVSLPKSIVKNHDIVNDIMDEEYRYQWIGHH